MTATRPRGRPKGGGLRPQQARAALIDAAERCFAAKGIDATTIEDVAAEAGVSRSLVYRHVAGREELLDEVIGRLTDRTIEQLGAAVDPSGTLADHVVELMASVVELVRSDPALTAAFSSDGGAAGRAVAASERVHERARSFAGHVLATAGADRAAELHPDLDLDAAARHLVLVGLALIQGYGQLSDDPVALRSYLRDFAVPPLLAR